MTETTEAVSYDIPVDQPPIQRGQLVRDIVTGVEGIAIVRSVHPSGNVMWAVAPRGKVDDQIICDDGFILYVGEGIRAREMVVSFDQLPFTFGDEVQDSITGLRGCVREYNEYTNGCLYIAVAALDKDGRTFSNNVEYSRLTKVENSVNKLKEATKAITNFVKSMVPAGSVTEAEAEVKPTGGPSGRMYGRD